MLQIKFEERLYQVDRRSIKEEKSTFQQYNANIQGRNWTQRYHCYGLVYTKLFRLKSYRVLVGYLFNQVLPLRIRVNPRVMSMKGYSTFTKVQDWSLTTKLFNVISSTLVGDVTSLQRCSRCIQLLQSTKLRNSVWCFKKDATNNRKVF